MSWLGNAFLAGLASRLRGWRGWLAALLLPACVLLAARLLPREERSAPVTVGVRLPEQGGEAFWELLESRSGTVVRFLPAEEDVIAGKVASGQWDCGLLLPEDFAGRLARQDTRGLITLCVGEGSAVYPLVRETAAACLLRLLSPDIAGAYLAEQGIPEGDAPRRLEEAERVALRAVTLDGRPMDALTLADDGLDSLLRGLTALLLALWLLFSAGDLGRWLETPAVRRLLPARAVTALLLPKALAAGALPLASAALALCLLGEPWQSLVALAAYWAALTGLALLAGRWKAVWTALPLLAPLLPPLCLLTSPVLLDPGALFPWLEGVSRWMPLTLFLRACGGAFGDGAALCGLAALALGLSLLLDRREEGRKTKKQRT